MELDTDVSPLDTTGFKAKQASRRVAKAKQDEIDEITTARALAEAEAEMVQNPQTQRAPIVLDEIEEVGVSLGNDMVVIRTIADIEDMTYGVGNNYTFKKGQKYSVPRHLAQYLEGLGYLWIV